LGKKTDSEHENGNFDVVEGKFGHLGKYGKVGHSHSGTIGMKSQKSGEEYTDRKTMTESSVVELGCSWCSRIYIWIPATPSLFLANNLTRNALVGDHLA